MKANRKLVNAGKMKEERVELFEKLMEMGGEGEEGESVCLTNSELRGKK